MALLNHIIIFVSFRTSDLGEKVLSQTKLILMDLMSLMLLNMWFVFFKHLGTQMILGEFIVYLQVC